MTNRLMIETKLRGKITKLECQSAEYIVVLRYGVIQNPASTESNYIKKNLLAILIH